MKKIGVEVTIKLLIGVRFIRAFTISSKFVLLIVGYVIEV